MNDIIETDSPVTNLLTTRSIVFSAGQVWQFHPELRLTIKELHPRSSLLVVRVDCAGTLGDYERSYGLMTCDVLRHRAVLVRP
jgi:hypothetical protein